MTAAALRPGDPARPSPGRLIEDAALVDGLGSALYEEMFDPRCDSEGSVWDDARSIAAKVATRFEQVGWLTTWSDGSESVVPMTRWTAPQPAIGKSPEVKALYVIRRDPR